jgi:hypothetical protein
MRALALLLLPAMLAATLAAPAAAQDQPVPTPPAQEPPESPAQDAASGTPAAEEPALPELQPGEVARIGSLAVLHDSDLDRYLGTVYARLPEGDAALEQVLGETLIAQDAAAQGLVATEADVDRALAALDAQARAAEGSDGKGLLESVQAGVTASQVREAVRLLVLHERLVRAEGGLPPEAPLTPDEMQAWLAQRIATAKLEPAPLDDPRAATFEGGELTKAQVGARLRTLLPPDELSGVLTEMIGVLLVRARANTVGVDLTTAAATREVLDRDAALRAQAGAGDVTYQQFVEVVQKRSLQELLVSDRFSTEVLIRELAEREWTEERARAVWEQNRAAFVAASAGKLDSASDWEAARPLVWRELRQRTYRRLFEEGRIARRF